VRVLVTGASRGIGRAVARRLHARGAKLALSARTLAHLSDVIAETPGSVGVQAELSESSQVQTLVPRAKQALGGLDAFVHCAGIVRYTPALEITPSELEAQLAVNFTSAFTLGQQIARELAAAGSGGAIVNVASTLATNPAEGTAAYAASKAALIAWTRALALELAPHQVRVNAVAPGIIDTDMIHVLRGVDPAALPEAEHEARVAAQLGRLAALHPLGRLGTPDEVAEAVIYLLEAKFVTGTVLVVDGGLTLR
jgi:NAD(P)-dependent dehydrogenase (short-subunit alcohol dehydrogenase family)